MKVITSTLRWNKDRRLLAFQDDGFRVHGAIVSTRTGEPVIELLAESSNSVFQEAVREVIEELRLQSRLPLPRRAVLTAQGIYPAVLSLPIHPKRLRSRPQMAELVRWELEPFFAQQIAVWPIGAILNAHGDLNDQQVQTVVSVLEERKQKLKGVSSGRHTSQIRFGELAVELGYISSERVEECLAIRERLPVDVDEIICGWSAPAIHHNGESQHYPWLSCGVSQKQIHQWVQTFKVHGIQLDGVYPLVGCAAALLYGDTHDQTVAIVEIHTGVVSCTYIQRGQITGLQILHTTQQSFLEAQVLDLLNQDFQKLWLSGKSPQLQKLTEKLSHRLKQEVNLLKTPQHHQPESQDDAECTSLNGLLAASRHSLNFPGAEWAVCVECHDPGLPFFQRSALWWAAAACLTMLTFGATEFALHAQERSARQYRDLVLNNLSLVETEIASEEERIGAMQELQKSIQERRQEFADVAMRRAFLDTMLPRRMAFISEFLEDVARASTAQVAIDMITENDRHEIDITGWSLSEKSAQQFAQKMANEMKDWGMKISEQSVWTEIGRAGLPGYSLHIRLIPVTDLPMSHNDKKRQL